ncbi:cobalamin biosynthesis protein CobQ [Geotoga petraea]|jgi:MinD-like ATPase involved in chromosome partitioning or flagellar assembly|uniref:Cobalamin biosynthesis protein CobQ n=1 Tax=Geotoga petraea TaxID=28234 RepID=A0A1G6HU55_9BACT|nr:cobalamin biosynthesis protein CobQ [Geotoga petraea]MDK2946520.1 hypothetical protein [Geotoga sp.]TGG88975.1 cobalamin biosynthesis protein CobQ [Geotoga petraea]SDB97819.1 hypothetical protein SAMN04488588_0121 [Geotoga petraea]
MINKHKVNVFIGMFGSGKTEISINTALKLKSEFENVAIGDIDTISPYFRTRDEIDYLTNQGIKVITPPREYMHADVPIIPPAVGGYIQNPDFKMVLDVGGNDDGAIVLGSLNNFIKMVDSAVYFVVNTYRPFTDEKNKIIGHIERLSAKARLNIDYLVSNSNVMEDTNEEHIQRGESILGEVSKELNIPIAFTVVEEWEENINTKYQKFTIKRFMKKTWDL